jgi:hypothetical protein
MIHWNYVWDFILILYWCYRDIRMVKKSIYGSGCPRNLLFTPK